LMADADEAFRDEVRSFLAENLTPFLQEVGRRSTSVFTEKVHNLEWQRILHKRGWAAPHWPVEYGGTGWTEMQRYIFASECLAANAPNLSPMGLRMVAPVIMAMGTPEQKAHYLPRILSGEDYLCQGYSEPQAGSDLAALQLRADKDGADYILNGSKIWTTHAHVANRMFALVRTSRDGRPQQGITFLLLDMESPGITVSPIKSIADDHDFNAVFFDNVRVPQANRIGAEDEGWGVAKYLLEFERSMAYAAGLWTDWYAAKAMAAERDLLSDPKIKRVLSTLAGQIAAIEAVEHDVMRQIGAGGRPGTAGSMLKIQGTETAQAIQHLKVEIAGDFAMVSQWQARQPGSTNERIGPDDALSVTASYFNGRAASIYAGSNEIQRGILAKMVLGL
jgi:alkylation response protein AidB-like acyl-CoA dehydrogenase